MEHSLTLIGTNFKQADLDRVAKIQWPDNDRISAFLSQLRMELDIEEAFFLQTCNRREFYLYAPDCDTPLTEPLLEMLARDLGVDLDPDDFYTKRGGDAARHAFRVASSLDSMVLGETEITKQIKDQCAAASRHGHVSRRLNQVWTTALRVSKQVRQKTQITRNVVSMASLAFRRVSDHLRHRPRKRVVFVGAGHFIQSILPTFTKDPSLELIFVNRSLPTHLAETYGGVAMTLEAFRADPVPFEAMIAATGAHEPLFDASFMAGRGRLLLLDAGLPRDIDEGVRDLEGVTYMDLEEMETVLAENRAAREAEIPKTEPIFDEGLAELYDRWLACDLAGYSREISSHFRRTGERALAHLMTRDLPDLDDQQRALLENWTQNLVGKLTTIPILGLKGVARDLGHPGVSSFTRQVAERAPLFRD